MHPPLETTLTQIGLHIREAEYYLTRLNAKMQEIVRAGMYPAVPTERWKDGKYLYLYFAQGLLTVAGLTLDAKGRVYIGSDPAKIEAARRMVENRRRWEALHGTVKALEYWLGRKEQEVRDLARAAERWPKAAGVEEVKE